MEQKCSDLCIVNGGDNQHSTHR